MQEVTTGMRENPINNMEWIDKERRTNSMAYGTPRFNAAFTRALQ